MANKIKISRDEFDEDELEGSDSAEYSEDEKELLKSVRKGRKKEHGNLEVLAFDESQSEDDGLEPVENSDFEEEGEGDEDDLARAWGRKKSAYYSTDFVDQDYSTYNEKEQELALQEEEEAKAIQQRLAKQLDEGDFSLDIFSEAPIDGKSEKKDEIKAVLKADLSDLSQRQKQQLFEKDSPEFKNLVKDFELYFKENEKLLNPVLEYVDANGLSSPIVDFIRTRRDLVYTYCTNIGFYLMLKAKRIPVKNHPVVRRLVEFKQLLQQLDQKYNEVVKDEVEQLLERINSGEEVYFTPASRVPKEKKRKSQANGMDIGEEELTSDDGEDSLEDGEEEMEEEEGEEDDRRKITYQIAKNKGLMPHRKKEQRNPRVKHRNKYRKALIRRKGAIRTVRKELSRYSGEISGIKSTVRKGIKLKS